MTRDPRITVFLPVYNREQFVEAAIDSVLAQTFADFELLVIDDASTDQTLEILASFRDRWISLIRNDTNLGIPATRIRALDLARGERIAMLDSDELAYRKRLAKQVEFLDRNPDHALVGSWVRKLDAQGKRKKVLRRPLTWRRIRACLLFMGTLHTPSVPDRLDVLRRYRFDSSYPDCSDSEVWARIVLENRFADLPEALICYRKHDGGVTRSNAKLALDRKLAVIGSQFDRLGMSYSAANLDSHWHLRKRKPSGSVVRDYVRWAREWLLALLAANQRAKLYLEPQFSDAVGERRCHLHAWDVATQRRGRVSLFDSALRAQVTAYLRGRIALRLRYGAGVA